MSKCLWITGLSATGKTTLSTLLVEYFRSIGKQVILLDGDDLRKVLATQANTREERVARGMRYSRLCKLISSQDVDVVIATIALFKEVHEWNIINIPGYFEIFIDTPIEELIKRDPKKLYQKYENGEIKNIAGLDLKVDFPKNPDIHIKWTNGMSVNSTFDELLNNIKLKLTY